MPLALPNISGPLFTLTPDILREGCLAAADSPRQRIILPLHRHQDALVQRMLNFLQPATYIQPHLHPLPHASETIHVLSGAIGFLIFEDDGTLRSHHLLQAGGLGFIDIEPNVWHGFIALEPDTVIIEIKRGPYAPLDDKCFASWAPAEGESSAPDALHAWRQLFA